MENKNLATIASSASKTISQGQLTGSEAAEQEEDDGISELSYDQAVALKKKMDMDARDAVEEGIQKTKSEE